MYNKITSTRLISQHLAKNKLNTPKELVSYMGAMQAQDFNAAKLAIGIRLPQITESNIIEAFNSGEILRTHVLRPTWHFVSPENIRSMLALSAKRNKAATVSRDKQLGITEKHYEKSNEILRNILKDNNHLTKDEIAIEFERHKICVDSAWLYHLLYRAEIDAIICSGALKNSTSVKRNTHTYALLDERVPLTKTNNEATDKFLPKLLDTYLRSHSAATLQDFSWWTSASLTETRNALEEIKSNLYEEKIDGKTYYIHNDFAKIHNSAFLSKPSVFLLPAFDEYLIAYNNRSAVIADENNKKAISSNGIFRPVIVANGQVCGVWKTVGTKKNIVLQWFNEPDSNIKKLTEQAMKTICHLPTIPLIKFTP